MRQSICRPHKITPSPSGVVSPSKSQRACVVPHHARVPLQLKWKSPDHRTMSSGSLAVLSQIQELFASPTPLASLVSGLLTLAVLAALYALFDWIRGRRTPTKSPISDAVIGTLQTLDRWLVH